MNIAEIKYEVVVDNKFNNGVIVFDEKCTSSVYVGELVINFGISNNVMNVSVKNNGSKNASLNSIRLELFSSEDYRESFCIINSKKLNEKITHVPMSKVSNNEKIESHLFEIFVNEENRNNKIFGFLGCKHSRNLIENITENNQLKIYAVYDFISQQLNSGEEIVLDSIYFGEGRNVFSLFYNFVNRKITDFKQGHNRKLVLNKSNTYSILFTYRANSNTLKVGGKPVFIKVNGKKLYAVDISTSAGKKQVFVNANAVLSRSNALDLKAVGEYINVIEANKLFNVNYELTQVLTSLKVDFEGVRFYSDDFPLGLDDEFIALENSELIFEEKRNLLDHFGKGKVSQHINYDFFIKLLLQRLLVSCRRSFSGNSPKINELMSVLLGSVDTVSIKNEELLEMSRDIDYGCAIIPFIERKKTFALLVEGRKHIYIAAFNMEKEPVKFYCDLNVHSDYRDMNGVIVETYTSTNYLISEGKLYVRGLSAMDCRLFKKPL